MSSSKQREDPAPSELLKYLPQHEVVVCTTCHYAVQPQAISRHLKEIHRVLRSRRRKFDLYVAGLCLRQPHEVIPPTQAHQFPVPCIPVESGIRCQAPGCGHLCISTKRMQAHWRTDHGCKANPAHDWRPAPLQTFFRGNLLRYFSCPETPVGLQTRCSLLQPLDADNAAILDHYFQHTYQTFVTSTETEHIWRRVVPNLASQHDFLLHGLLACTALHQAYLHRHNPARVEEYVLRACALQEIALPGFRTAIETPSKENCDAILSFAYLLVVYSFASTCCYSPASPADIPEATTSLFLIENGTGEKSTIQPKTILPNWLYLLRGGCSMICDEWESIREGPVRALSDAWDIDLETSDERDTDLLARLLAVIPTTGSTDDDEYWSETITAIYTRAAIQLSRSFAYLHRTQRSPITTWDVLRVWPMEVSMEYMNLLHQEHPGALILLAHYCILLKYMEGYWYFDTKAKLLICTIQKMLGARWGGFIQGALDTVLGDL
ncbi:hypothetical protein BDW59DRAFT_36664 [Aspergillus cavernicola]|uniref:C2H2-type domain-containing protein n=1 Tax=Aspergillus cavernicola TaxID=176166 RepID=A0ABR4HBD4_9EURO